MFATRRLPSAMYKTKNGGMTWEKLNLPAYYDRFPKFPAAESPIVWPSRRVASTMPLLRHIAQRDDLRNQRDLLDDRRRAPWAEHELWLPLPFEDDFLCEGACTESAARLSPVSCSSVACYAVGEAGTVVRSTDRFAHWQRQASPADADLWTVARTSPDDCYAGGGGGTILTREH